MTASLILHSAAPSLSLATTPVPTKSKNTNVAGAKEQSQEESASTGGFREALQQYLASKGEPQQPLQNSRIKPAPPETRQENSDPQKSEAHKSEQQKAEPQGAGQPQEQGSAQHVGAEQQGLTPQQIEIQPAEDGRLKPAPQGPAVQETGPRIEDGGLRPAPQGGEPALAARVTKADAPVTPTETSAAPTLGDVKPDANAKDSHSEDPKHQEPEVPNALAPAQAPQSHPFASTAKTSETESTTASHAADFEIELARYRTEPVRGAHVQITGAENQRVDIHMVDQGGTLSLTMRSSDQSLTKSLQEHAPELNARLASEHYRAELWTPTAAKSAELHDLAGGNRQAGGDARDSSGQSRQNNQSKQQQPTWLQDFEDQAKTIQNRIEYTWHQ